MMSNPNELGLGELITTSQQRDAVHVAVVPVVAGQKLAPATHVGFLDDSRQTVGLSDSPIGIIDPFLEIFVTKGQQCWLFLYPGTITSLRHDWTHPAFENQSEPASEKQASIEWLKSAAVRLGVDYETLISDSELTCGDYIDNGERIRDIWYELCDEFWKHRQIATGVDVEENNRGGFTCSC